MATFDLLPAIDLRSGRVVRLQRGDFARETAYSDDPVGVATAFVDGGARWLHIVDLDGARDGWPAHGPEIQGLISAIGSRARVEVAGGLRSLDAVAETLDRGAARVVLGTRALGDPAFVAALIAAHGQEKIAVSLDVREGLAIGHGWVTGAPGIPVAEAVSRLVAASVRWIEVTAIERDGTLEGPDLDLLRGIVGAASLRVIASGGIGSSGDIEAVRSIGCVGAIVGRALYDGTFKLEDALAAAR